MENSCKSLENSMAFDRPELIYASPWPHFILDDFLSKEDLLAGIKEISEDNYEYELEGRGTGRIEFSLLKSKRLWRSIYSRRVVDLLTATFGVSVSLNKHNMLQLRRMNDETPAFPLHSDFTSNEDTIASFLYLSDDWVPENGGRLLLYETEDGSKTPKPIEPIRNRFVAFQTKSSHWHSVERVHNWNRYSVLALWDVNKLL